MSTENTSPNLAVFIKTCYGRPSLLWVLDSIQFALKDIDYRIYISDEKPLDEWKIELYDSLKKEEHHVELHDKGIGCGTARNKLVESLREEDLILRMDDDFELGGEFKFKALENVLFASDQIGFCSDYERQIGNSKSVRSGSIRPAGGEIVKSSDKIIKKFHGPFRRFKSVNGYRYAKAEFTRNLLLVKREVFDRVRWNERLKFQGEHLDFMLSIKKAGYSGAYTPDSIHYHRDDLTLFRYYQNTEKSIHQRPGDEIMSKVFKEEWGVKDIKTGYPFSWYMLEAARRLISKII